MPDYLLLQKDLLAPGIYRFRLEGNLGARPGQFVMVRAWPGFDPLLARPFSVHDQESSYFSLLFQVRGRGTKILSQKNEGEKISILGPLGTGFDLSQKGAAILVAGGLGIAPFLFLAKELRKQKKDVFLFYGARTQKELLLLKEFEKLGVKLFLATEDGSRGHKGFVTEPLIRFLENNSQGAIYACGPLPMLKAVGELSRKFGLKSFVSLEAHMACGLGMCLGCVVPKKNQGYLHVCIEGPVVPAEFVF